MLARAVGATVAIGEEGAVIAAVVSFSLNFSYAVEIDFLPSCLVVLFHQKLGSNIKLLCKM